MAPGNHKIMVLCFDLPHNITDGLGGLNVDMSIGPLPASMLNIRAVSNSLELNLNNNSF